jgi:hypothetical protein
MTSVAHDVIDLSNGSLFFKKLSCVLCTIPGCQFPAARAMEVAPRRDVMWGFVDDNEYAAFVPSADLSWRSWSPFDGGDEIAAPEEAMLYPSLKVMDNNTTAALMDNNTTAALMDNNTTAALNDVVEALANGTGLVGAGLEDVTRVGDFAFVSRGRDFANGRKRCNDDDADRTTKRLRSDVSPERRNQHNTRERDRRGYMKERVALLQNELSVHTKTLLETLEVAASDIKMMVQRETALVKEIAAERKLRARLLSLGLVNN